VESVCAFPDHNAGSGGAFADQLLALPVTGMISTMLADSWVQTLRGWCEHFSAIAEALERGDFRFFEDGRDVTLEWATKYRKRVSHFEQLIADSIAAPAQPVWRDCCSPREG